MEITQEIEQTYPSVSFVNSAVSVSFSYYELLSRKVFYIIKDKIEKGYCYTCIIKVKYGDHKYYMVASNFSFKNNDNDNSINVFKLYDEIYQEIDFFLTCKPSGQDLFEEDLDYFDIVFRRIDSRFFTDLRIDFDSIYLSGINDENREKDIFKKQINYLPLTTDKQVIGNPINNIILKNGKVTSIIVIIKHSSFDFLEKIEIENQNNRINLLHLMNMILSYYLKKKKKIYLCFNLLLCYRYI